MKILFLSRWYPFPPDNGSKIRVSNLLRGLCQQHKVTLISFFNPEDGKPAKELLGATPDEIRLCPYREFDPHRSRALLGYLSRAPRYLIDTHSSEMDALIQAATQDEQYDLVIASQLSMAAYYRSFRSIPAIFEEVELGIYQPDETGGSGTWRGLRQRFTWSKQRRFTARLVENFRLCTVASDIERHLLATVAPDFSSVYVIPNSIAVEEPHRSISDRIPGSLVFTGSLRFTPNYEAMAWFLHEIYPLIKAEMPEAHLKISGDPGSRTLPAAPNVQLTGKLPDVRSLLTSSAVSLAPIRSGGGTRLKILESMALGTPVVATSKGVEGLDVRDGEHLLIADSPTAFARAVLQILREPSQVGEMVANAFELVRTRYNWQHVLPRFMSLVERAASSS